MSLKVIPFEVRQKAWEMFCKGATYKEICKELGMSAPTLYKYIRDGGWIEKRKQFEIQVMEKANTSLLEYYSEREKAHIKAYANAQEKAGKIFKEKEIHSAEAAFEVIDKSIKGERGIAAGAIHTAFIEGISDIMRECIERATCPQCGSPIGPGLLSLVISRIKLLLTKEGTLEG